MLSGKWSRQFSNEMAMSLESFMSPHPLEVRAPVFEGLQIIVSLNCRLRGGVNGRAPFPIDESGVYLVLTSGQHEGYDCFEPNVLQRCVRIGIGPDSAQRSGLDLGCLARSGAGRRLCSDDLIVVHLPLTPAVRAIATQALLCPYDDAMRDIYLAGKGLELTAAATGPLLARDGAVPRPDAGLSRADLDCLWHARELVARHFQQPPSLHALARQVGINVKKLTQGYRQLFGTSVFEHIQQVRLHEGYRMLCTGGYSVSEAASFVGYTIPHFSTLFRKHFGFPPSRLVH
ncbi:MAG: AraC family transcriptional regulator [Burkholderiaceae bacterium]